MVSKAAKAKRARPLYLGGLLFDVAKWIALVLLCFSIIVPFMNIIAISFSGDAVKTSITMIVPKGFQFNAYRAMLTRRMVSSFFLTIFVTAATVVLHLLITLLAAYPLSRKYLRYRKALLLYSVITMLFSGGLIPYLLLIRGLGLRDNILVYIIPGLGSAYNLVLMKNFMNTIPASLEEAARIDGANHVTILFRIMFPLMLPIVATLALFTGVGKWNDWFTAVLFITDPDKYLVQNLLRAMIVDGNIGIMSPDIVSRPENTLDVQIKMAAIVFTAIPVVAVYPFLQKYFVKGILIGGVKE